MLLLVLGVLFPLTERGRESRKEKKIPEGKNARTNKGHRPDIRTLKKHISSNLYSMTNCWFLNSSWIHPHLLQVWFSTPSLNSKRMFRSKSGLEIKIVLSGYWKLSALVRSLSKKLWRRDFISRVIHHYNLSTPPTSNTQKQEKYPTHFHLSIIFLVCFQGFVFGEEKVLDGCTFISFFFPLPTFI